MFNVLPTISDFLHSEVTKSDHSQYSINHSTPSTRSKPLTSSTLLSTTWDSYIPKLSHYNVNLDANNAANVASELRITEPVPTPDKFSPPHCSRERKTAIPKNQVVNQCSSPKNPPSTTPPSQVPTPKTPILKNAVINLCQSPKNPSSTSPPSQVSTPKTPPAKRDAETVKCCEIDLENVKAELENQELWAKFNEVGNEMLITRSGRLMFPLLQFKLSGLSRDHEYNIGIKFLFVDEHRYRFSPFKTSWKRLFPDKSNDANQCRYYEHTMSPASGEQWNLCPVSFPGLKLCSYKENAKSNNMVHLPAMRKYRIQLVVTRLRCAQCEKSHVRHIDFPLTEFIAVTSYNNNDLKQLKIENNPRARYLLDDELKKSAGCSSKSTQTRKKLTKAIRTNRKRKRQEVPATMPAVEQNPEPSPKMLSYWSQQIEASPLNAMPALRDEICYIDLNNTVTTSVDAALETGTKLCHTYDTSHGNALEMAFSLSTKHAPFEKEMSYQSYQGIPCYYSNLCGSYYTLNYDSYYGCTDKQLEYSGVKQYHIL